MPPVRVQSRFPEITGSLASRVEAALKEGADEIAQEAKNRVPIATGRLRDSIHVEFEGSGSWGVFAGGGSDDVFYGHLVEFGTTNSPAQPFLIPAAEARKGDVEKAVRTALARL